ncbi:hypothetical protein AVEN_244652-1 [Araneus ventricosus]|uniref:Uncharacterized protein n=1 Tax=Araneus ventricosus TaxID=182803 RepID=A0A4Y2GL15_ARAVE|nr:hypothetical protein AVEN_244652-1 [Araneus ventricosus]
MVLASIVFLHFEDFCFHLFKNSLFLLNDGIHVLFIKDFFYFSTSLVSHLHACHQLKKSEFSGSADGAVNDSLDHFAGSSIDTFVSTGIRVPCILSIWLLAYLL